ncbi:hypothetical protein NQZ68_022207 [Dissostichus eleginoides]|nr:hypothetical protein NQZ68_022207 [Dissostichus eleginoides]
MCEYRESEFLSECPSLCCSTQLLHIQSITLLNGVRPEETLIPLSETHTACLSEHPIFILSRKGECGME